MAGREWGGSLHLTFRLLPTASPGLQAFLESDGRSEEEVLGILPYDAARGGGVRPDPRRYRDGKQVYQTAGLLYEDDGFVHVTELGRAVRRWLAILGDNNVVILGRHAAHALAACQLRNPTRAGAAYDADVEVFPFSFVWRAMVALDDKISTDELNRAIFRVANEADLGAAIARITEARRASDPTIMGPPTIATAGANDRVIPWMALASFGWTLINDKRTTGSDYYEIRPRTRRLLRDAAQIRHRHREFPDVRTYVDYVSSAAALPPDLR